MIALRFVRMSWKCLLCGYVGEQESASESFHCCSWCVEESKDLHPREVSALIKLEEIQPYFSIWNHGRRDDSIESVERNCVVEPQPAKVFPGLQLFIGDIDDAANVQRLCELGIGCVVNLCPDQVSAIRSTCTSLRRFREQESINTYSLLRTGGTLAFWW